MDSAKFTPSPWLSNAHLQTIFPLFFRKREKVYYETESLFLPDADFVELCHTTCHDKQAPLIIILHGLQGSIKSKYVLGMMHAIEKEGWRSLCMQFRNCGQKPNLNNRTYHFGDTGDLAYLIQSLRKQERNTKIGVIGFSLGGNVLLKYLGETRGRAKVDACVAVSVPYQIERAVERLESGFSKIYQFYLLKNLKDGIKKKYYHTKELVPYDKIMRARTLREFDDLFTAPYHGFENASDYYKKTSSAQFLKNVRVRTLLIHSLDDPFMYPDIIPPEKEMSSHIELVVTEKGGHVGFIQGSSPFAQVYWAESRAMEFFKRTLG